MGAVKKAAAATALVAAGAAGAAYFAYRSAMAEAEEAWRRIASAPTGPEQRYDPAMVAGLPEVAKRYFNHAIAPGTPLRRRVELRMRGTFLLGDAREHSAYRMAARQILAPPDRFVWIPELRSGVMRISGSDALVDGSAWTRFWLMGLVPVANVASSPDVLRSARFRSTVEAIWAPAALLPQHGVEWEQTGPDSARVTFPGPEPRIAIDVRFHPNGALREVVGQRWSNANPEQIFRLQPFGGTIEAEASFGGFTIPSRVRIGNHYGTSDYLPFFQAEIVDAAHR